MLNCKACGADVKFDPATQKYVCEYCGSTFTHEELDEEQRSGDIKAEEQEMYESKADSSEADDDGYIKVIVYTCPQCGGELFTTEETAATFCSYCGASVILEKRVSKEMKPDYIIPFQITREQAAEIYKKKLKGSIFAPSYMKNMSIEKVRGIYMPYWTYEVQGSGTVSAKKTETIPAPGGAIVNEYNIVACVEIDGDGIEYDSASTFPDDLSQAIAPYKFSEAKEYESVYMSGFYADAGDMPKESYVTDAQEAMREIAAAKIAPQMDAAVSAGSIRKQIPVQNVNAERAMYPVWFISAKNKAAKKVSYAVINGQTGKIAADIPVDNKKLLIGMLCIAIPVFAILYFLITPTPLITTFAVLIFSVIGMISVIRGSRRLKNIGKAEADKKAKQSHTLPLVLIIIAVAICVLLILFSPSSDLIFYIGVIIAGLFSGIGYWTMFTIHNKGTLRKLPQLGKRGGDE